MFQFDAYKTIKAIEIFCIKAFAYSEYIKRMLYCWKKEKFAPETEIIKLLDRYAPKKKNAKTRQRTKER